MTTYTITTRRQINLGYVAIAFDGGPENDHSPAGLLLNVDGKMDAFFFDGPYGADALIQERHPGISEDTLHGMLSDWEAHILGPITSGTHSGEFEVHGIRTKWRLLSTEESDAIDGKI